MCRQRRRGLAALLLFVGGSPAIAADRFWIGDKNNPTAAGAVAGTFFGGNYWLGTNLPPGADDNAVFGDGALVLPSPPNGNVQYLPHVLHFGDFVYFNLALGGEDFVAGGTATTRDLTVTRNDWTFDFRSGSSDGLHNPPASIGSYVVTGTARIGASSTPASLTLRHGSLTVGAAGAINNFNVGFASPGSVTVDAGATLTTQSGSAVGRDGGNGSVLVRGIGSSWASTSQTLDVGQGPSAFGTLSVLNGGRVDAFGFRIGDAGGNGTVLVSGLGSTVNTTSSAGGAVLGTNGGHATLQISDGAQFVSRTDFSMATVGLSTEASVSVSGSGTRLQTNRRLLVGQEGRGSLEVSNGAVVSIPVAHVDGFTGFLSIGAAASAVGTTTIRDAGTSFDATASAIVGSAGTGTLNVNGGALLTTHRANFSAFDSTQSGILGRDSGSKGSLTIDGVGSRWLQDGVMFVGYSGDGTATVSNGGRLDSGGGVIARNSGSNSRMTLGGDGSRWTVTDSLYVGGSATAAGGTGVLRIRNGASVSVGGVLKLWPNGTLDGNGGTIAGDVLNAGGVVSPGESPGTLLIDGDLMQSGGRMVMELAGVTPVSEHDVLTVTGAASLGGVLEIRLLDGFVPTPGATFDLFHFGSVTPGSQFASLSLPTEVQWDTTQLLSAGTLRVVPEPSLSAVVLTSLAALRRQHRRLKSFAGLPIIS